MIGSGAFERHLRSAAKVLKSRRAALLDALKKHAGANVQIADSSAGMHLLAWLPRCDEMQAEKLVERARGRGLGLYLVAPYCMKKLPRPGLLLGYADLPPADLLAAVKILGDCLRD